MKRLAAALGILAGGVALFFLSTFTFLAAKGQLNEATLVRLPIVGRLFEREPWAPAGSEFASLVRQIQRLRADLARLEGKVDRLPRWQAALHTAPAAHVLESPEKER